MLIFDINDIIVLLCCPINIENLCLPVAPLRGDTPKPFLPGDEIWLHIIKVYLETIRFDTLEIIFEYTLFRKKNIFFFEIF